MTSPEQKREIALAVNAHTSKSGKTQRAQYINDPEDIVKQYREYLRREHLASYEDDSEVSNRHRQMIADMISDLGASQVEYHMPALIFFFKRYLTQH